MSGTQCTQQKLKLISGWSHSWSVNAMPQRIAKSSSKYPPKTQWKQITQLIYSQYSMITKYCIKFTEKPKNREMEIRKEQPTWISTSHKQLRNSPKKKMKYPKNPRWGILASGVCTLRPAHQDLHTEVPRTPTPSCAECMKYYKTLVTMSWWQFIWTHTHTNDIWRMLKNQIIMIIWIWCIMNVLAELRIENVSQAGLPKYNI